MLAVGRLLDDQNLLLHGVASLDRFTAQGLAYDGFCNEGTLTAQRRLLDQLDGWFDRLMVGAPSPRIEEAHYSPPPLLALARTASAAPLSERRADPVQLASFPAATVPRAPRAPALLGGTGLARLAVGAGEDALDIELRGLASDGPDRICRQALRVAVGGKIVLGDLDETDGTPTGFEHASVSRNTVVVGGLNQRESLAIASRPMPSGNFLYFAADPDFQVAMLDDPKAYPNSTSRYRQTVIASAGPKSRYAVSVFEVHGGSQHDQIFHGAAGASTRWALSEPTGRGPKSVLPPGVNFLPLAPKGDGRWFVQSYGEFQPLENAGVIRPTQAWLTRPTAVPGSALAPTGVRLHLLNNDSMAAITPLSPDPLATSDAVEPGRGTLILRREIHKPDHNSTLRTTFVTVFEPIRTGAPSLQRVGRVAQGEERDNVVVIVLETADGPEHLIVNLNPGRTVRARLNDGRMVVTDGLAVRVQSSGIVLAGGTFADASGRSARQRAATGRLRGAIRTREGDSLGWFESDTRLPDPDALAGRIVLVQHGDGTTRGWTLLRVENTAKGARLLVREDVGFQIDPNTGAAVYDRGTGATFPGPHEFRVARVARALETRP